MTRIPKILNLVEEKRFDRIVETIVSRLSNEKKIMYRRSIGQLFAVMRLMLLTIIITFFVGCSFYFIAALEWNLTSEPNFIS